VDPPDTNGLPAQTRTKLIPNVRQFTKIITAILLCAALYFARSFFVPIALAFIIALTLSPLVQFGRRYSIPASLGAAIIITGLAGAIAVGASNFATPLANMITEAPRTAALLKTKLKLVHGSLKSINKAGEEVEKLSTDTDKAPAQEVVVKQPGILTRAADDVLSFAVTTVFTLVLTYFLLTSRDMFLRKVIKIMPRLSDKKKALSVAKDIENDVSKYLLTVSMINTMLGIVIGTAFWLLGMPNPLLWGIIAGFLNFLPYIGSGLGMLASTAVAIISFPTLSSALLIPAAYLFITALEGQFLTPMILGRRFSLNTVIILVSLAFWGFLWGPAGVLIAVPILIIFRVMCEHIGGLAATGEFLSGEETDLV